MSDAERIMRPPQNIVLATDLDSHTDRAMDRATQLARQWHATLHVVHVRQPDVVDAFWPAAEGAFWPATDGASSADAAKADMIKRQIRCDLREVPDDLVIHVVEGEPAQRILDIAARVQCELLVVGSRGPSFAGVALHSTTAPLLRRSPHPLLIVKSRPRGAYDHVLVGTDFTTESRHGLETAAAWFAPAHFTLVHALDIPYRSMLLEAGREQEFSRMERDTMRSFVAAARLPDEVREHMQTLVEHGPAEIMLRKHGVDNDVDLTVVGTLKRGLAFRMLVGGNAVRIAQTVPGDILMVRASRIA